MQVKILYEPLKLVDLYQEADVLVLPIFVDVEMESVLYFDQDQRILHVRSYLKERDLNVIGLPENMVVMFICVRKRHNKKRILKKALHLYMSSVLEDFQEFDVRLPGLHSTILCVASGDPLSDYYDMPKSKYPLCIYTGQPKLDRLFRRMIRIGEFERYNADSLAHPTVRVSFERTVMRIAKDNGFDLEIVNVMRHGRKALVTCDTMDLEVS